MEGERGGRRRRWLRPAALLACVFAAASLPTEGHTLFERTPSAGSSAAAGSGSSGGSATTAAPVTPGGLSSDQLRQRAQTTLQAIIAMQAAARSAAAARNAGTYVTASGQKRQLPDVPDGLAAGGLVPDSGLASTGSANPVVTWTGAGTPVQTTTTAGSATQTTVTVTQTSQQAILNWQTFNVGRNTTLNFDQSAGGSNVTEWVAFNKVGVTGDPSQILGTIQAQGQVYLINPNGIIFGGAAQVNAHALVASSLPINDGLVARGLLNNPDSQFLFSATPLAASANTPAFTPGVSDPPLDAAGITANTSYTPARAVAGGLVVTVGGLAPGTLVAGQDYTVVTDAQTGAIDHLIFTGTPSGPVTVSYTPAASQFGNVTVQAGALLKAPTTPDHVGGRVALIGPNVTNNGTISTEDGQAILAAGLQVGLAAHPSSDPTLRGLDVYIGAVTDPSLAGAAGIATNGGQPGASGLAAGALIEAPRGNVTMAGAVVNQLGAIDSSTSVAYDGRIDLLASYAVQPNSVAADATGADPAITPPLAPTATGSVNFGPYSVTRILPEIASADTVVGTQLALPSIVDVVGHAVHFAAATSASGSTVAGSGAVLLAPNASNVVDPTTGVITSVSEGRTRLTSGVTIDAGDWYLQNQGGANASDSFVYDRGQIYFDSGSAIDVSGSRDVAASVAENIVSVQLRGPELANSPLQQNGPLRGQTVNVDLRDSGVYNGQAWLGTPLADTSGYVGLVHRTVGELTAAGGTVSLAAGDSVVLQPGSAVNVSGGWTNFTGATVQTTQLLSGGRVYDIAAATPNLVYDGIYTGTTSSADSKWGTATTTATGQVPGTRFDPGYIQGANAGAINVRAPSMVLDGSLYGNSIAGPQQRTPASQVVQKFASTPADLPTALEALARPAGGAVSLTFSGQGSADTNYAPIAPTPPNIVFAVPAKPLAAAGAYSYGTSGADADLKIQGGRGRRGQKVDLSPDLINVQGFGSVAVDVGGGGPGTGLPSPGGKVTIPAATTLLLPPGGSLTVKAANIDVEGQVTAAGGSLSFTAFDFSDVADLAGTPALDPTRGQMTLGPAVQLSVAGLIADDTAGLTSAGTVPLFTQGGGISAAALSLKVDPKAVLDVSGGASAAANGKVSFGNAGSISLLGGEAPSVPGVVGGGLTGINGAGIAPAFRGYAGPGAKGGTLTLQDTFFQIGGGQLAKGYSSAQTFWIDSAPASGPAGADFFSQGGFSQFSLIGLGAAVTDAAGVRLPYLDVPGVRIAAGTTLAPTALSLASVPGDGSTVPLQLAVSPTRLPPGARTPVSLSFTAAGLGPDDSGIAVRGDLLMEANSSITVDPGASVTFKSGAAVGADVVGGVMTLLGRVRAPGGTIGVSTVKAAAVTPIFADAAEALPTIDLGPGSSLDASGTAVYSLNPYGLRTGSVLPGGTITLSGNLVAEQGAVLAVNGAAATLDETRGAAGLGPPASFRDPLYVPVTVDSAGGTLNLFGGQELYSDATLRGGAGGPAAAGGSLNVVSGRYYDPSVVTTSPLDIALTITAAGPTIPATFNLSGSAVIGQAVNPVKDAAGNLVPETGHFAVSSLAGAGFDYVTLGSSQAATEFIGSSAVSAGRSLTVAPNGVIVVAPQGKEAAPTVTLTAPYIRLGAAFPLPVSAAAASSLAGQVATGGAATVTARASDLIDVGDLSLQGIGSLGLLAGLGAIRGDGAVEVVGDLNLQAAQIYPTTLGQFTLTALAPAAGSAGLGAGIISVQGASAGTTPQLPLSAGGTLSLYASSIAQSGFLRAPDGTINLGWDGAGAGPTDPISGAAVPITRTLTLAAGSLVSVSGADPQLTTIPFGLSTDGAAWIDPSGTDITVAGAPAKAVRLSAQTIVDQGAAGGAKASSIDLTGGGDLYAYQWIKGNGGTKDLLEPGTASSFAVIPGYAPDFAPVAANGLASSLGGDPGYVAGQLRVGDRVYLNAGDGLPAGGYTLLPARYALLPGAFLVTPLGGDAPTASSAQPDGAVFVSGYRFNALAPLAAGLTPPFTGFEIASGAVVRTRSQYADLSANSFLAASAAAAGAAPPQLPKAGGQLVLAATNGLTLQGTVADAGASGGAGGLVDLASPVAISIGKTSAAGGLVLDPDELDQFGASSLLIGGVRTASSAGETVTVATPSITVDNGGHPLSGPDVTLVASGSIVLAPGAQITQSGTLTGAAQALVIGSAGSATTPAVSGNGVAVRVSADPTALLTRADVMPTAAATLTIGAGAQVSGAATILDATGATTVDPQAAIGGSGSAVSLGSGQISLQLSSGAALRNQPGTGAPSTGLVLSGDALSGLEKNAGSLQLLSYSSIDLYGSGTVGSAGLASLALRTPEIWTDGGQVAFAAGAIRIDNVMNAARADAVASPTLAGELDLRGGTVTLGANTVWFPSLARLSVAGTQAVLLEGAGGLSAAGDLNVMAPVVQVDAGSAGGVSQSMSAAGNLTLTAPSAGISSGGVQSLGAQLALAGGSVTLGTRIALPAGQIAVAAAGDLNVQAGALLDVGGSARSFAGTAAYTNAGGIKLSSQSGSVTIAAGARLNLAAAVGGGDGGSLQISAPDGQLQLAAGTLAGDAGLGGAGGAFSLDVSAIAGSAGGPSSLAVLGQALSAGGFTSSLDLHVRTGDVAVDGTLRSHAVAVTADAGSIAVTGSGQIDASGPTGGSIVLSAAGSVLLESGADLSVQAQHYDTSGRGGSVDLRAGLANGAVPAPVPAGSGPQLNVQSGSTIDLSVVNALPLQWNSPGSSVTLPAGATVAFPAGTPGNDEITFASSGHLSTPDGRTLAFAAGYTAPVPAGAVATLDKGGVVAFAAGGTGGAVTANVTPDQADLGASLADLSPVNVTSLAAFNRSGTLTLTTPVAVDALGGVAGVQIAPLAGNLIAPSAITVRGLQSFTPVAGVIDTVVAGVDQFGQALASDAGTAVVTNQVGTQWAPLLRVEPAAEILNPTAPSDLLIASAGSTIDLAPGAAAASLAAGASFLAGAGTELTLNVAGTRTGALSLPAGGSFVLPVGSAGGDKLQITSTSASAIAGTVTTGGTTTAFTVSAGHPYAATFAAGTVVSVAGAATLGITSGAAALPVFVDAGSYVTAGTGTTTVLNSGGALTLANSWNLSGMRYGSAASPGELILRAAGNVDFLFTANSSTHAAISIASLSDGFDPSAALLTPATASTLLSPSTSALWTAPLLGSPGPSWSYAIVAGADLGSSDWNRLGAPPPGAGSVELGLGAPALPTATTKATSQTIVPGYYQTIRTGAGAITIGAARDIDLENPLGTIYTAGMAAPALAGFQAPLPAGLGGAQGQPTQPPYYPAQYTWGGGDVSLSAGGGIRRLAPGTGGTLAADSSRELPTNWLYRRGAVGGDGAFGTFKAGAASSSVQSTSWWVDFSNFFEGVGALGGGSASLSAGGDIANVDAAVATNERTAGTDASGASLAPAQAASLELGGGNLRVSAGGNLDGGVYYVERGSGLITAAGGITTNVTRTALDPRDVSALGAAADPVSELPTSLLLGLGSWTVRAAGDVRLGAVANPFLLPAGTDNGYYNKSYFSTFGSADAVSVSSLTGSVTLAPDPQHSGGSLATWYTYVLGNLTDAGAATYAASQPWLGLTEAVPSAFAYLTSLMPPTLTAIAFTGDVDLVGNVTLASSPRGNLALLAAGGINGVQKNGLNQPLAAYAASGNPYEWNSAAVNLSDASLAALPGVAAPLGLVTLPAATQRTTQIQSFPGLLGIFSESGATSGSTVVLQSEEILHGTDPAAGLGAPLHITDATPAVLASVKGDISGVTLYSAKPAAVTAGRDLTDVALYVQNLRAGDLTRISAGRDLIAFDPGSALRLAATAAGNHLDYTAGDALAPASGSPAAGDIQIAGPGSVEVLAGRNLNLGTGVANASFGLAVGLTTIGNTRNPLLPFAGADIVAAAGLGAAAGSGLGGLDFSDEAHAGFVDAFLNPSTAGALAQRYLPDLGALMNVTGSTAQIWAQYQKLTADQQEQLAVDIYYLVLRDAARDRTDFSSPTFKTYANGDAAIAALFPAATKWNGSIALSTREIETANGGRISLLAPGGGVTVGRATDPQTPDQGVLTAHGGDIGIFARDSVSLGTSRIFTLHGGNIVIWSSRGDIAAGSASKTVHSAPPTRVLIDPQSADVQNDLAGLATGGGIGVLATLTNVAPGTVDLIAPIGTIDAGDAGIRASGAVNVSALHVLNASNIQAPVTSGVPVVAVPNIGAISSASGAAAAASAAATQMATQQQSQAQAQPLTLPSIISVEVLGYGGGDGDAG